METDCSRKLTTASPRVDRPPHLAIEGLDLVVDLAFRGFSLLDLQDSVWTDVVAEATREPADLEGEAVRAAA